MRSALARSAACFVAWFVFPALAADVRLDRPSPTELTSKIEEYMAARVERDQFSGTVLLAQRRPGPLLPRIRHGQP